MLHTPSIRLQKKRVILVAGYFSIEPIGIEHLAGIVQQFPDWECRVVLIDNHDFTPLYEDVRDWQPDLVGFQIWTGNHMQAFEACDRIRAKGIQVIIGGPHASYFHKECEQHADIVVKGEAFRIFRRILEGEKMQGTQFDPFWFKGEFPRPDRRTMYARYPQYRKSRIKSMFCSVGCPYKCSYCYAPAKNAMYDGFKYFVRPVDDIIDEVLEILEAGDPLELMYGQDDIFAYKVKVGEYGWLDEFNEKWKEKVKIPFHVQLRLELTRHDHGQKRLDLLADAGCTGVTMAIESADEILRNQILLRPMTNELIMQGCNEIRRRGMTLRTEQIMQVPCSDRSTDLATLELNEAIGAEMAWSSVYAPYRGTTGGDMTHNLDLYRGNNDDLTDRFFDRSVLRHVDGGPRMIEEVIKKVGVRRDVPVMLQVTAIAQDDTTAKLIHPKHGEVGEINYLSSEENDSYCNDGVLLQRTFMTFAKAPNSVGLAKRALALSQEQRTWNGLGEVIRDHLDAEGYGHKLEGYKQQLAVEMGFANASELPETMKNPYFLCLHPGGGKLGLRAIEKGVFDSGHTNEEVLDSMGTETRRHLFEVKGGLYGLEPAEEPIFKR